MVHDVNTPFNAPRTHLVTLQGWCYFRHTTSRNMAKKEPQLFSHCGSFDHLGMQPLNDYIILFSILRLQNWMFWSVWYTVGKVFSRNTNVQLFNDCRAWWSKEPQWKNDCSSFLPCFLLMHTQIVVLSIVDKSLGMEGLVWWNRPRSFPRFLWSMIVLLLLVYNIAVVVMMSARVLHAWVVEVKFVLESQQAVMISYTSTIHNGRGDIILAGRK